ncbi:MAG: leucine-rich repeat domain-containing protein [Pseudoflavonifractor sp.]|nr:leucine-rich repeat domain-containing protein [Pseudoflavonifractor sp.]
MKNQVLEVCAARFLSRLLRVMAALVLLAVPAAVYADILQPRAVTGGTGGASDSSTNDYDFEQFGVYYKIMTDRSDLCVSTCRGPKEYMGKVVIPETVKYGGKTYKVVSVTGFDESPHVTSITIPRYVETIKRFYGGSAGSDSGMFVKGRDTRATSTVTVRPDLREIIWNADSCTYCGYYYYNQLSMYGSYSWEYCFPNSVERVVFGRNVKSVPKYSFAQCSNLKEIVIPESVKYVGEVLILDDNDNVTRYDFKARDCNAALWWPKNRTAVKFHDTMETLPKGYATYLGDATNNITMPSHIKRIAPECFYGSKFTSVNFSPVLEEIGDKAFASCRNLSLSTLPTTLKKLGKSVFEDVTFDELSIPGSWDKVGEYAFYGAKISSLILEEGITTVDEYAFLDTGIEKLQMPNSLKYIRAGAFEGLSVDEIVIPDGVEKISYSAFAPKSNGEISFRKVTFPKSVKDCETSSFSKWMQWVKWENGSLVDDSRYQIIDTVIVASTGVGMCISAGNCNTLIVNDGITELPDDALRLTRPIKKLILPETLKRIGSYALSFPSDLASDFVLTFPPNLESLGGGNNFGDVKTIVYDCESCRKEDNYVNYFPKLKNLVIGPHVKFLDKIFWNGDYIDRDTIDRLVIPETVKEIRNGYYTLPISHVIEYNASAKAVEFEDGIKRVVKDGDAQLYIQADKLVIGRSVSYLPKLTCYGLKELEFYASGEGDYGEMYARHLKSVIIGDGVRVIPACFLMSADSLTHIELPNSLRRIGEQAFLYAGELKSLVIPHGVTEIGRLAFHQVPSLESLVIPHSVTKIGDDAFSKAPRLKTLVIPEGVIEIGENAFNDISEVKELSLPSTLVNIGRIAFTFNDQIETLWIPSNVEKLTDPFVRWSKLKNIYILNTVPPQFFDVYYYEIREDITLYVPKGCKEAYQNAQVWSFFKNIVEMEEDAAIDDVGMDGDGVVAVGVVDGRIEVSGLAADAVVEVYNMSGVMVYRGNADEIPMLPQSLYVVRCGSQTTKIKI